ncbi:MAG: NYN domain-containing protein [Candidatus Woesearchaeota archaeon]
MKNTVVFLDAGFLSKLSKHMGNGSYIKFNLKEFSKKIARKRNLFCTDIFYYTAPPFQSTPPSFEEKKRKVSYDSFLKKINSDKMITVREGRVQKIKNSNSTIEYKQKGVDTLLTMDLMLVPLKNEIKTIILVACDSDFVPVIQNLQKLGIKIILYTYFEKSRASKFSTSNELIQCVNQYHLIEKEDFVKLEKVRLIE